jgi:hypothetical protein
MHNLQKAKKVGLKLFLIIMAVIVIVAGIKIYKNEVQAKAATQAAHDDELIKKHAAEVKMTNELTNDIKLVSLQSPAYSYTEPFNCSDSTRSGGFMLNGLHLPPDWQRVGGDRTCSTSAVLYFPNQALLPKIKQALTSQGWKSTMFPGDYNIETFFNDQSNPVYIDPSNTAVVSAKIDDGIRQNAPYDGSRDQQNQIYLQHKGYVVVEIYPNNETFKVYPYYNRD